MRHILLFFSFLIVAYSPSYGQNNQETTYKYSGLWLGIMNVTDEMSLQLAFEIEEQVPLTFSAKMNVIEQKAFDIAMDECTINNDTVRILLTAANIVYEGVYNQADNMILGSYIQGGSSFTLNLSRVDKLPLEIDRPQTPVRPFPYEEEIVHFENKKANCNLEGTLTMPASGSKFSAVILIAGSGRTDRDETSMGHFLLLSDYLTRNGYAVLRYDKRGVGKSGGDYLSSTTFDFAEDVASAIQYLKNRPEVDVEKIGLIGHSEGALLAPMVAANNKNDVSFIVMMGGIGVKGAELLLIQSENLARVNGVSEQDISELVNKNKEYYSIVIEGGVDSVIIEKLKMADPDINNGTVQMLLLPWFRTFLSIDPGIYLQKVECPVLAITGEKDLQCSPTENLQGIENALKKGGNNKYVVKTLPGLNHLFQTAKSGSPYEYDQLEEIISPTAQKVILDWMLNLNN